MKTSVMKKLFSLVVMGVMLMASVFSLSACNREPTFEIDQVCVTVKMEYLSQFDNEEFTVEDFGWGNVKSIFYYRFNNPTNKNGCGAITVYFKNHGVKHVNEAITHFETLYFVLRAQKVPIPIYE